MLNGFGSAVALLLFSNPLGYDKTHAHIRHCHVGVAIAIPAIAQQQDRVVRVADGDTIAVEVEPRRPNDSDARTLRTGFSAASMSAVGRKQSASQEGSCRTACGPT